MPRGRAGVLDETTDPEHTQQPGGAGTHQPRGQDLQGGRTPSFNVLVVGDGNGHVGAGIGKAKEVPERSARAWRCKKNIAIPRVATTIPHTVIGQSASGCSQARRPGNGSDRGRAVRAVLEVAGVRDVLSKSLGSATPSSVRAAMDGLQRLNLLSRWPRPGGRLRSYALAARAQAAPLSRRAPLKRPGRPRRRPGGPAAEAEAARPTGEAETSEIPATETRRRREPAPRPKVLDHWENISE